jgi:diacylglycerol kinase family enzyme
LRIIAVLNRDGGTLRTMDLTAFSATAVATFARHGHELECQIVSGREVDAALRKAATSKGVDAVMAGGGDGTISTAAGIAYETGMPLAVLPVGTMNLFARALKVPLVLEEALEAIAGGEVGAVDIATANDRAFVHQFGVGVHARLVRIRENLTYGSRYGKMLASLRAIAAAASAAVRRRVPYRRRCRDAAGIGHSGVQQSAGRGADPCQPARWRRAGGLCRGAALDFGFAQARG